ncbi:MAG: glycosyltransferase involved in cell wall biosynthesis [Ulvibacter sp.]|jgi:glycosyltransferase involved in cell wall biosynthesis
MNSVFSQTFSNFEYIVVDGASTDGSVALIEAHKDKIAHWVSEPDSGIYNAMNKGITAAKGDYLLFLNSGDDFTDPSALEKCEKDLTGEDIISFDINVVPEAKPYIKKAPEQMSFSYLAKDTLAHQSTFIRKDLFERIGYYDEKLKIVSDWKFFIIAICKFNATYKSVEGLFSTFYMDGISTSSENITQLIEEREQVLHTEFAPFLIDMKSVLETNRLVNSLRGSKKIQLLVKLGLIHKF